MASNFYSKISPSEMEIYAKKAGFGSKKPVDLQHITKLLKKCKKILEVGCGTGRLGIHLIKKYDYVGVDRHKKYVSYFRSLLKKNGIKNSNSKVVFCSFQNFNRRGFDAIIFPGTVIADFSKKQQLLVLKKAKKMLTGTGIILLDNPSKGTVYNSIKGSHPTKFYFGDWKTRFNQLGFANARCVFYKTKTKRMREITVLENH